MTEDYLETDNTERPNQLVVS